MQPATQAAIERGRKFLEEVNAPFDASKSSWFDSFSALSIQGWSSDFLRESILADTRRTSENLVYKEWQHTANGGAHFCALYDVQNGTIFSFSRYSPHHAYHQASNAFAGQVALSSPPPLAHWSDVTYLQWAELCNELGESVKGLKSVIFCHISTRATHYIIDDICGEAATEDPGQTFTPDQDEFLALLGTENAQGLAFLLAQHKGDDQLGKKSIKSVQVFTAEETKKLYMVFELE